VEIVASLEQISKREFFAIALPILVEGLDSAWSRTVIIEDS